MTLLLLATLILLYVAIFKQLKSFWFCTFTTLIYIHGYYLLFGKKEVVSNGLHNPETYFDPYFQYHPIRTFLPILVFFLFSFYSENKKIQSIVVPFVIGFFLFWNLDTGFVVICAWLIMTAYVNFYNLKIFIKKFLRTISFIFLGLLAFDFIYFVTTGEFIVPNSLFKYQELYYSSGYYMLPMPMFHPWNIVILVYLVGLIFSLSKIFNKEKSNRDSTIIFLSVFGLGIFTYYQGRSHDRVLPLVIWPFLILITIFFEILFKDLKNYSKLKLTIGIMLIVTICAQLYDVFNFNWNNLKPRILKLQSARNLEIDYEFLRSNRPAFDKPIVLSFHPTTILSELQITPSFCPTIPEISFMAQIEDLAKILDQKNKIIILDMDWVKEASNRKEWQSILIKLESIYTVSTWSPNRLFAILKQK
jgi:hypothetical protein